MPTIYNDPTHDRLRMLRDAEDALQARIPLIERELRDVRRMLLETISEREEIERGLRSRRPKAKVAA